MKIQVIYLKDNCYSWGMKVGDVYDVIRFEDDGRNVRIHAPECDDVILYKSEYKVIK